MGLTAGFGAGQGAAAAGESHYLAAGVGGAWRVASGVWLWECFRLVFVSESFGTCWEPMLVRFLPSLGDLIWANCSEGRGGVGWGAVGEGSGGVGWGWAGLGWGGVGWGGVGLGGLRFHP